MRALAAKAKQISGLPAEIADDLGAVLERLDDFRQARGEGERITVTVDTIYREIEGDDSSRDVVELFGRMVRLEHHFAGAARP